MRTQPVRWWPASIIAILTAVGILAIWSWPEIPRQQRILRTGAALVVATALATLWLLLFSRLRWKTRLSVLGAAFLVVFGFAATFRIRGVSGDLLPILEARWTAKSSVVAQGAQTFSEQSGSTNKLSMVRSGEFPQFYGPNRNAVLPGPELQEDWASHPPKVIWKQAVGSGWSGFALKDGLAITMGQRGDEEFVACYQLLTGQSVWAHSYVARYATTIAGEGPRSTPTIVGDRVYTFGATGILNCLDLFTGKAFWTADTAKDSSAKVPDWGFSSSPLVVDDQVIVSVGGARGTLHAYSVVNGQLKWAEGGGLADYSSPMEATLLGIRQILNFHDAGVSGHSLEGKVLWNHPWPGGHPHVTAPIVVSSNEVLISSGYGTGSELVKLEKQAEEWRATRQWKSMAMKSKFGPIFVKEGYIYGLDDGIFTCVELKTGQRKWKDGRYGHGQGLLVGKNILLTSEKGEVILIEPNAEKLVELARFKVFSDKTWNPPALAGEYLLMRNDKEAACLQLQTKAELARNVALSFAKPVSHR